MRPMQVFTGKVIEGEQHGTLIGFPTANIALTDPSLSGIYAGTVAFDGEMHRAALYADQRRMLLESHLLDFSGNVYGRTIVVTVEDKIRDDKRFESVEELKAAVTDDISRVRAYFTTKQHS
jgi:riboflavin kinase/FMN adenylyltransferase